MYQQNQRCELAVTHITKRHRKEDSVIKHLFRCLGNNRPFMKTMLLETDQLNDIMFYRLIVLIFMSKEVSTNIELIL